MLLEKVFLEELPNIQIKIASRANKVDGKKFFDLNEVAECDLVIPAVPIKHFESTIKQIKPFLKNNLVLDVCSVKMHPKKVLLENLSKETQILCTHPNFGPESYRLNGNSLAGLNFIIDRVRCEDGTYNLIMQFLESQRLNIIPMDSEEHDRTVGLPHFISMFEGTLVNKLEIKRTPFGAASTQKMFDMVEGVGKDFEIMQDMFVYNPFCSDYADKILESTKK